MADFRMIKNNKAITLIELIMALTLSCILLTAGTQFIVSHGQFSVLLQAEAGLAQETAAISSHIASNVSGSKYVVVGTNQLDLYDYNDNKIGSYTWSNSDSNLYYPDNTQLVSNKLGSLTITAIPVSGFIATKLIQVDVTTKNPLFSNLAVTAASNAVYCRLSGDTTLVRLMDSTGTTKKGGYSKIQAAIDAAVDGYQIWVRDNNGVSYKENITINNKTIALKGGFDNSWDANARGHATIIEDAGSGSSYVVNINNSSSKTITVDGFTIRKGNYGGIDAECSTGTTTISNSIITNNGLKTSSGHGGIYGSISGSAVLTVSNNNVYGNTDDASSNYGGGINIYTSDTSSVTVSNNIVKGNKSTVMGGGIRTYNTSTGTCTITNNVIGGPASTDQNITGGIFAQGNAVITSNTIGGNSGDGIFCYNITTGSVVSIKNNKIIGNTGWGINGDFVLTDGSATISDNQIGGDNTGDPNTGGIYINPSTNKSITVNNNSIINNHSTSQGGGIFMYCNTSNTVDINRNEIRGNTATYGGGMYVSEGVTCYGFTSTCNLIVGNTADYYGGGIEIEDYVNCSNFIDSNTIVGNTAKSTAATGPYGGGIFLLNSNSASKTYLRNSIICSNFPDNVGWQESSSYYNYYDIEYCDIGDSITVGATYLFMTRTIVSGTNTQVAPVFVGSGDYHLDATDTACIDKGNPATGFNDPPKPGAPTLALYPPARSGVRCDMGAYGNMNRYASDPDKYSIGPQSPSTVGATAGTTGPLLPGS